MKEVVDRVRVSLVIREFKHGIKSQDCKNEGQNVTKTNVGLCNGERLTAIFAQTHLELSWREPVIVKRRSHKNGLEVWVAG